MTWNFRNYHVCSAVEILYNIYFVSHFKYRPWLCRWRVWKRLSNIGYSMNQVQGLPWFPSLVSHFHFRFWLCKSFITDITYAMYQIQRLLWFWLFHIFIPDPDCSGEMFWRDYQHWLCCVPNPWPAMVQISFMVLSYHLKLFLLWGESCWLFWSCYQPNSK